jgi:hypothetical protein
MEERTRNNDLFASAPIPAMGESVAAGLCRGVCRLLADMGYAALAEFRLTSGRRVDVMGLSPGGEFLAVEIKSSLADFRSDGKWPEYRSFCDRFYFAVAADFPRAVLPADCGLIVADAWQGVIRRDPPLAAMNGNRRRNQILRFGRTAAYRLHGLTDPPL